MILFLTYSIAFLIFSSCNKKSNPISTNTDTNAQIIDNDDSGSGSSADYSDSITEALGDNCDVRENAGDYSWAASAVVRISLNGNEINVNITGASVEGNRVIITSAGNYSFSGTLTDRLS